jgi:hypothetical protein
LRFRGQFLHAAARTGPAGTAQSEGGLRFRASADTLLDDPVRHRNGTNVSGLAHQVGDDPMLLTLLKVIDSEMCNLPPSQPTAEHQTQNRSVPAALQLLDIGCIQQGPALLGRQPIPKSYAYSLRALDARMPAASSGLRIPVSAASYASRRTVARRRLIVAGARRRASSSSR